MIAAEIVKILIHIHSPQIFAYKLYACMKYTVEQDIDVSTAIIAAYSKIGHISVKSV